MAGIQRRTIENSLKRKGFKDTDASKHKKFILYVGDRKTSIGTVISRGEKYRTIYDKLLGEMAKQLKLEKKQFIDLIDCPLEGPQYIQLLRKNNHITDN